MSSHLRQAVVNALSMTVTALILLLIAGAVQAAAATGDFDFSSTSCPTGRPYAGHRSQALAVGFVTDPFQIRTYQRAVGRTHRLGFYSNFEAWARDRDPSGYIRQAT